mgnify:CR=1 FL=1
MCIEREINGCYLLDLGRAGLMFNRTVSVVVCLPVRAACGLAARTQKLSAAVMPPHSTRFDKTGDP